MQKTLRLALSVAALMVATTASAQQRPMLGVGVSFNPFAQVVALSPAVEVYVPIRLAPAFRLEPSLGIFTYDEDGGDKGRDFTLGIGAFFVKAIAPAADMYAGARLKLNFARFEDGNTGLSNSDTDLVLAGALGGEYYLAPQFSLGLEAQLGLYQRGEVNGDDSGFFTNGLAFLRFYF